MIVLFEESEASNVGSLISAGDTLFGQQEFTAAGEACSPGSAYVPMVAHCALHVPNTLKPPLKSPLGLTWLLLPLLQFKRTLRQ